MKRSLLLLLILMSIGVILSTVTSFKQQDLQSDKPAITIREEPQATRNPPNWTFDILPMDVMASFFDYMPGSYYGLPLHLAPDANGGGYFMTFMAKNSASATRKVYYAKIAADGTLAGTAAITTNTNIEGYPALEIDLTWYPILFLAWWCGHRLLQ
jgi:hypothetical protein